MMTDYPREEKAIAAIAILKMKVQQTVEDHLQDTSGVDIIFEDDAYKENEEIQIEDLD